MVNNRKALAKSVAEKSKTVASAVPDSLAVSSGGR
jgi:hypothetical protein